MEDRVGATKLLKNYLSASTGCNHDWDYALSRRAPDTANLTASLDCAHACASLTFRGGIPL
jgi:hypothetical protein